jgi:hypothetical protein
MAATFVLSINSCSERSVAVPTIGVKQRSHIALRSSPAFDITYLIHTVSE